jgi:hypothetical protein
MPDYTCGQCLIDRVATGRPGLIDCPWPASELAYRFAEWRCWLSVLDLTTKLTQMENDAKRLRAAVVARRRFEEGKEAEADGRQG